MTLSEKTSIYPQDKKPGLVQTVAILTLINGILISSGEPGHQSLLL
jgi:hypothetical protein